MEDLAPQPVPTGRHIIQFQPDAGIEEIRNVIETKSEMPSGVAEAREYSSFKDGVLLLDKLKAGITDAGSEKLAALSEDIAVVQVRPEFYLFDTSISPGTLEWMREGLYRYIDTLHEEERDAPDPWQVEKAATERSRFVDTNEMTWGLRAVGADKTALNGAGIKVCILDTGLDFSHPDFINRPVTAKSFVRGAEPQDGNGHGTHVAGTLAGPCASAIGRRYGIASGVDLYIGKVLADNGAGFEFDVLSGIDWAIKEGCQIISMSLGRAVRMNEQPDPLYEAVGKAALDAGCLIIAAAGNESSRTYGYTAPVGSPANATTIMSVASIDPLMKVSSFSCGATNIAGGEVDIAGPGTSIYSAWPNPRQSRTISGTSMATPHVSAVAALLAQDRNVRGRLLWDTLTQSAKALGEKRDFGAGLVQVRGGAW